MTDDEKVEVMRRNGIVYPVRTLKAAKEAGLHLDLACAILDQESDGGHNVFGHDPTIFVGAGEVTQSKYLEYKRQRDALPTRRMQGVGPVQLTWYEFQDRADALGGCWRPYLNMLVGFRLLAYYLKTKTAREAAAAYNGSGPYDAYANTVMIRLSTWHIRFA